MIPLSLGKKSKPCAGTSSAKLQRNLSKKYNLSFSRTNTGQKNHSMLLSSINHQLVDWDKAENEAISRTNQSSLCAICHEYYCPNEQQQQQDQCILSCSHVFHSACLSAFEKYVKFESRFCPLCRKENYTKRPTVIGGLCRITQAAIILQTFLRAMKARQVLRQRLASLYGRNVCTNISNDDMLCKRREQFYMKELEGLGNMLLRKINSNTTSVNMVSASIEESLELSRDIRRSLNDRKTAVSKATDWDIIMKTAFDRRNDVGNDETAPCAICMSALERKKRVSLLSCSHMFCTSCIDAFERFTAHHATPSCPVCRMPDYEKLGILL